MATLFRPQTDPRVPPAGTRMTLEEFFALPDDARVELVDGMLHYMDEEPNVSPASRAHGSVAAREPGGVPDDVLGEVFPPDLAVEILSPSHTAGEMGGKVRDYMQFGVRLVWVVDTRARSVAVYGPSAPVRWLHEDDVAEGNDVVSGFRMPVAAMFAGLRRRA